MFSPEALNGGGAFDYFRDTMRHVGRYAQQRGITLDLINGVNVAFQAGSRTSNTPFERVQDFCRKWSNYTPRPIAAMGETLKGMN